MRIKFFTLRNYRDTIRFAGIARAVSIFSALSLLCGDASAQEYRSVHDGVEHAQMTHMIANEPVKVNLLRLDLTKVRLDVKLGMDMIVGTETTSSIAARHGAVAAINSGFFRLDSSIFAGDPAGLLMTDGALLSESVNGRAVIMINNRPNVTEVDLDRADVSHALMVRGREIAVGTNRELKADDAVLFTQEFGRSTLSRAGSVEFLIQNGRVRRIFSGGSNPIPQTGYIVSASGSRLADIRALLTIGTRATITVKHSSPVTTVPTTAFGRAEDITNGVSFLVRGGRAELTWEAERSVRSFAENRHPRTAVAKMRDGKLLMITADGRQPNVSVGMTLQELADFLVSLGAVDAINLDGGGSTAMVLDGKLVSRPSDPNGERKVGDAIIVTLRKPAAAVTRN
jgi:exopolysaccharide biosynthesis protein